ncbi:MAG: hypothetical protein AAF740_05380 [Bacteroidota bacterium]
MKTLLQYATPLILAFTLFACGGEQPKKEIVVSEEEEVVVKEETKSEENAQTEAAGNHDVQLVFNGFIDKTYNSAFDAIGQELYSNGPMLVTITFETPENGGGSISFGTEKLEEGSFQLVNEPMKGASVASGKYVFKAVSGNLTVSSIAGGFITGTLSDVVFEESTNFGAEGLTLVSGSFKVPMP